MKKIIISSLAIATAFSAMSCRTDFDKDVADITPTSGEADFSNYVALGNSLTAGYRDGALYLDGQMESYPNIIAGQMKKAGGGDFTQPLLSTNEGGLSFMGNTIQASKLYISDFTNGTPNIQRVNGGASTESLAILEGKGTYNNMGVPGAKVAHLLAPNYGNMAGLATKMANPYFVRFASSPSTSVIADFKNKKPSFFSLWIGNNDALLYALAGADSSKETLTPVEQFRTYYTLLINEVKSTGAKGVIANIPDVTTIPSLTTVPYNPINSIVLGKGNVAVGEANIDLLNKGILGPLKQILTRLGAGDRIELLSKTGNNPLLIKDESLTDLSVQITQVASQVPELKSLAGTLGALYGQARHTKKTDLIPLTTRGVIGSIATGLPENIGTKGIAYPLEDEYVLTSTEIKEISETIAQYNTIIKDAANANGYAFVDANAKMVELSKNSGLVYNGTNYNASFVSGGAFSLDGVHLTGRGYAVIANEFIKAINAKYNSTLFQVNPNNYSGVKFP